MSLVIGFLVGILMFLIYIWASKRQMIKASKLYAGDLITEAKERAQELSEDSKRSSLEYEDELKEKFDTEINPTFEGIETLKLKVLEQQDINEEKARHIQSVVSKKRHQLKVIVEKNNTKYSGLQKTLESSSEIKNKYIENLCQKLATTLSQYKPMLHTELIETEKARMSKHIQSVEEETHTHLEKTAKRILGSALHRFQRPYCPERGIHNINFPSDVSMTRTLGANDEYIPLVESLIGVDLTPVREKLFLNVSAFDPVRRELTRKVFEKMVRDKRLDKAKVERIVQQAKKSLFKKVRSDGNALAKELHLRDLHPEIKNLMGSLRYRYSFSQNQYYHCGEVGWLCGLLSSEMGLNIYTGRRAGMLHDLGKSMDHSIDGGHAVIGADFIDKHGEEPHIVHAVRAHHYDETPNSDLAFLVIASDAMSGARPGARRSTAENYFHKMNELERIGNSFKGVHQTFILSAGREIRVMVDARRFDDYKALDLSKQLAEKIEEELTYPGQIRVTVVRETQAIQYAK